ncbi:MAG: hypothetical protein WBN34_13585, partial [Woeseia sp.]
MHKSLLLLSAVFACASAFAQQSTIDEALEAPMQALDNVADLQEAINEDRRRSLAPAVLPERAAAAEDDEFDEIFDDEEAVPEIEEKNAFSGLRDDFEHDDVDIYNAP